MMRLRHARKYRPSYVGVPTRPCPAYLQKSVQGSHVPIGPVRTSAYLRINRFPSASTSSAFAEIWPGNLLDRNLFLCSCDHVPYWRAPPTLLQQFHWTTWADFHRVPPSECLSIYDWYVTHLKFQRYS